MNAFDPHAYGQQIAELLLPERLNELGPGRPNESARKQLEALRPQDLAAVRPARDLQVASACCAGLWLYHGTRSARTSRRPLGATGTKAAGPRSGHPKRHLSRSARDGPRGGPIPNKVVLASALRAISDDCDGLCLGAGGFRTKTMSRNSLELART